MVPCPRRPGEMSNRGDMVADGNGGIPHLFFAITPLKPGSATYPLPGVVPKILREDGTECDVDEVGFLVIANPWPEC